MNEQPLSVESSRVLLSTISDDEAVYAAHALMVLRGRVRQQHLSRDLSAATDYIGLAERRMGEVARQIAANDHGVQKATIDAEIRRRGMHDGDAQDVERG